MTKKLLITGASGFLGYHLLEEAFSKGYEVYAGVRQSSNVKHLDKDRVKILELDLSDLQGTQAVLAQNNITHIIHGAALTRAKTQNDYNFSNAELARNLAIAATRLQPAIQKFVFISSLAATGPSANNQPITEEKSNQPVTLYGRSKLLAEKYLAEIDNLPLITLRPTAVYEPREKDLLLVIRSIYKGLDIDIGSKEQKISFVYAKDLAKLAVSALETKIVGGFYNISDGQLYNRYSLANAVKKASGKKAIRIQLPFVFAKTVANCLDVLYSRSKKIPVLNRDKLNELTAPNWWVDISKARNELGFNPSYDLDNGMADTINWYKENKWI